MIVVLFLCLKLVKTWKQIFEKSKINFNFANFEQNKKVPYSEIHFNPLTGDGKYFCLVFFVITQVYDIVST